MQNRPLRSLEALRELPRLSERTSRETWRLEENLQSGALKTNGFATPITKWQKGLTCLR